MGPKVGCAKNEMTCNMCQGGGQTLNKEPNKQGMCCTVTLPIYILKNLKAKEESWKLKYFTMQKYNLQKICIKETKILQDIVTL
jgi:hypothetical protein